MLYSELIQRSQWLRQEIFEMVARQGTGLIPSCFSSVEILVALYYSRILNFKAGQPDWVDRDRFIMSKGHAGLAQYPILADLGYFPKNELAHFTEPESLLGLYADIRIPGIEGSSGSLGHGLGLSAGFALAAKYDNRAYRNFALLGDGECYEGSIWEAAMFAAHHQLDNLVAIIDCNELCIMGRTEELLNLGDLESKWKSFGWHAVTVDGHSYSSLLEEGFSEIDNSDGKPVVIIAKTTKGKGISFMEDAPQWHFKSMNDDQENIARKELETNRIAS